MRNATAKYSIDDETVGCRIPTRYDFIRFFYIYTVTGVCVVAPHHTRSAVFRTDRTNFHETRYFSRYHNNTVEGLVNPDAIAERGRSDYRFVRITYDSIKTNFLAI